MSVEENIKIFEELLTSVDREGIDKVLAYIRKSDFYRAPASTKYHNCHEGGLVEHSLNVFSCLTSKITTNELWKEKLKDIPHDTFLLVSLLHDICKSNFYGTELKNKKVYSETGAKTDSNGRYDWQTVPSYTVDDKIPYGHGEKSVMMLMEFIKMTPVEKMAIRWHMGFTEPKEQYNTLSSAIEKYPLILALHEADLEATYLLETNE